MGGENRFLEAFRFDLYSVTGALAQLGATWTFIEKAMYFFPAAVLLPVAGWLVAREIMGPSRWTLLTPLLLVANTYFMLEADGEVPLVVAEGISLLVLLTFLRTMRSGSPRWAIGWSLPKSGHRRPTAITTFEPATRASCTGTPIAGSARRSSRIDWAKRAEIRPETKRGRLAPRCLRSRGAARVFREP